MISPKKPLETVGNNNVTVVQLKPAKNKNITVVKHAAKQLKPKPKSPVANYSVRPVKSIPLQTLPEVKKNNSITVVQLSPKQIKSVKSKPPIANYSVKPAKKTSPQKPPVASYSVRPAKLTLPEQQSAAAKSKNITVVELAPKQMKTKAKVRIAKPIDLTYKVNVTPPTLPKSKATVRHAKITQLIPTPKISSNKVAKVTKTIVKKPSIYKKKRTQANREDQPIVFSPLPAKSSTEQDNNRPIILMN